jgi:hypothetical protein
MSDTDKRGKHSLRGKIGKNLHILRVEAALGDVYFAFEPTEIT